MTDQRSDGPAADDMMDEALILAVQDGVFQPEAGLFLAPVRHHSPACAWALQQMIREIQPVKVLIEAPHNLEHLIPHLLDQDTVPPVAAVSLLNREDGPRLSAYYPFCAHSPEWVAVREGAAIGAELRFIDLGSDAKDGAGDREQTHPHPLAREHAFDRGDYVMALCQRLGCRDGYELWDYLFETRLGEPDWQVIARDLTLGFAARMRTVGHGISVPSQVELLRSAETLARLRNRPGALRHDLIDGLTSTLVKGEASGADAWTERFITYMRGHALGEVSDAAGQPPIVVDARTRARALRFDLSDSLRRERSLDIRRKPAHLAASRFAHAMALLGTDFATRSGGPDFLNSVQTGLLFEHWDFAWSPRVEGQLIEAAIFGDTVPAACLGHLAQARTALAEDGRADDLAALLEQNPLTLYR